VPRVQHPSFATVGPRLLLLQAIEASGPPFGRAIVKSTSIGASRPISGPSGDSMIVCAVGSARANAAASSDTA
jgi:hypothetical protein